MMDDDLQCIFHKHVEIQIHIAAFMCSNTAISHRDTRSLQCVMYGRTYKMGLVKKANNYLFVSSSSVCIVWLCNHGVISSIRDQCARAVC